MALLFSFSSGVVVVVAWDVVKSAHGAWMGINDDYYLLNWQSVTWVVIT